MPAIFAFPLGSLASDEKSPPAVSAPSKPAACNEKPGDSLEELWKASDCQFKNGKELTAVTTLRQISRKFPREIDAYVHASWLLWREGQNHTDTESRLKWNDEALEELNKGARANPSYWEIYTERGDFYFLRLQLLAKAYADYLLARKYYAGDEERGVPAAQNGRKAAIEDRISRTAEMLDRKGEAVEASCRALFFDPDDGGARKRLEALSGSCIRKKVRDPRLPPKEHS